MVYPSVFHLNQICCGEGSNGHVGSFTGVKREGLVLQFVVKAANRNLSVSHIYFYSKTYRSVASVVKYCCNNASYIRFPGIFTPSRSEKLLMK